MAHAGSRTVGLDGVVAQQENYRKSGFRLAYRNVRYGGTLSSAPRPPAQVADLADIAPAQIAADDATVFPAPGNSFLHAWIDAPGWAGAGFRGDDIRAAVNRLKYPLNAQRSLRACPLDGGGEALRLSWNERPHSITSSARASSVGGSVTPSACAVFRLMRNSK